MTDFFILFASFWRRILELLSSVTFTVRVYGQNLTLSLTMILFTALVFSILIGVFWKGARA